ncbi:PilC/PilY family type IV pilus protein [Acinetobacter wuhouensis]|uniref:Pilus assembly protein PilY n=1 Tax=Acinetobacter wuhouensis TaxID=1879050 RepID=A0A3G2T866_9GAMM|nr:PilC/PilY family type IV pilus protein [Acinetobacter wuhouensis]AYO55807.1 pilus assembly protein PilY [Acinetobacter wuhouensis]
MKTSNKKFLSSCRYKILATSIAAISTMLVSTSVTQASDIEIYQDAKSGDITLMFLIDVSGSMDEKDGTGKTRITRVKDAMDALLNGTDKISDDKIIGLSTLGALKWANYNSSNNSNGAIIVPARALGYQVTATKTQRALLLEEINKLTATTSTPTGTSYLETVSYMLGNKGGGGYQNYSRPETKQTTLSSTATNPSYTGYYLSPNSLTQSDDIKKCSGQGIYVLTDGEPNGGNATQNRAREAVGISTGTNSISCSGNWACIQETAQALLDPKRSSKQLKFKTAVVGFGSSFNNVASYDPTKNQAENLAPFLNNNGSKKTNLSNVQEAAYWGIVGEGGWYSGNSTQDVIDSVNDFISNLSKDIPSVTTGSPTIPRDALNPAELQNNAYYQTFQPTPNTNYQLWLGNLKKYLVGDNGVLKGKNSATVFETDGSIKEPTYDDNGNITSAVYDYWAKSTKTNVENSDENTVGSKKFAARGGAWSQMLLGANVENKAERKLLTNRKAVNGSFAGTGALRQVQLTDLTDATYKTDPNRGYLLSLLGYNIDVANLPTTVDQLKALPNLRQMGAVMHSYPLLVTNKGKLEYNKTTKVMESTGREDYVLFGTTQGLLHVVDAETGVEKFAFVPNEMVEKQKDAFRLSSVTTGGLQKLYYGIDGAWSLYTQYVVDNSGNLVVGEGRTTSQQGMQMAYGGLRMGGRSYYALDLSNIDSPKLKFHIDPASKKVYSGDSSTTFSQLQYMGQSWSKPSIGWVNWGGKRKRVMFVGGGYDAGGDDGDAHTNGVKGLYEGYESATYNPSRSKGAGIYMFDADNGDLLWWASDYVTKTSDVDVNTGVISTRSADLKYSVVSEIRTVDRDGDDLIDHLYFGDLGGQLFRIDLDNKQNIKGAVPKDPVKLLTLNAGGKSPRFYDMPGFSLYNQNGTTFAVISQGSGNRSVPLDSYTSSDTTYDYDAIYNIYDKDVARRDLFNRTAGLNTQNLGKTNLGEIKDSNRFANTTLVAPFAETGGWYYRFQNCTAGVDGTLTDCNKYKKQSEKVFGTPLAMNYKLYVSTFDASKPGISGDCGAGVKGESMLTAFCMPFGQCASKLEPSRSVIGVGIHTVTVGGRKGGGTGGEEECVGESCPPVECKDETCPPKAKGNTSATNYCINTSGRIALTVTGGFGNGEATEMCLIPQRWYEKLARKAS